jgi:chromate transporter
VLGGLAEIAALLIGGAAHLVTSARAAAVVLVLVLGTSIATVAAQADPVGASDAFFYFAGVGSLLIGSGYVLLPILEGDLVASRGWLTSQQLLDAVAVGQATPGPVFTTATFVGYVVGGPWVAAAATAGIFLPPFVFSALASSLLPRISRSTWAAPFLAGVNAAAVALIGLVLVSLARAALTDWQAWAIAIAGGVLLFGLRVGSSWLLLGAALLGLALSGLR